ncbi:MAG: hypothetical protein JEZ05_03520 [Tenericutes bacterium]|nr:hypothetical protein [Mycoplasmatota bacterium]
MNDLNKRLNEIYPPSVFNFIVISLLCIGALFFTIEPGDIFNAFTFLVLLVWFNVFLASLDIFMIRRNIFKHIDTGKKQLVSYLKYRVTKENRKIRLLRRKEENPKVVKLKKFILDIEKDIIKIW